MPGSKRSKGGKYLVREVKRKREEEQQQKSRAEMGKRKRMWCQRQQPWWKAGVEEADANAMLLLGVNKGFSASTQGKGKRWKKGLRVSREQLLPAEQKQGCGAG